MALWGKTDNLAGKPKFVARKAWFDSSSATVDGTNERISLLNSNTGFSTGDAVVYSKNGESNTAIAGLIDGNTYYVRVVAAAMIELYDTYAHAINTAATDGRVGVTATVAAETHTLQRTGAANPYSGNDKAIFFVDRTEAQLDENKKRGIKGGGWWLYSTYTDTNGVTRHKASCLVAMDVLASTSGDAPDDEVVADKGVTITNPANRTIIDGNTTMFATTATTDPAGGTVTFQWQVSTDGGTTWSSISDGGVYSNATTTAMTVTAPDYSYNGNKYRVVVAGTGYTTKTSNAANLTITPVTITVDTVTDESAVAPAAATFEATAATAPTGRTVTYQWEQSIDAGETWTVIPSATSATYVIDPTAIGMNDYQYRVKVSRLGATTVTSNNATLTVTE